MEGWRAVKTLMSLKSSVSQPERNPERHRFKVQTNKSSIFMHFVAFILNCTLILLAMPFSKHFDNLVSRAEGLIDQHRHPQQQAQQNQYQQYQQQPIPPSIPFSSKPNYQSSPAYWTSDSSSAVSSSFQHKTGQTGWGNNELQNYTDNPQNSFYSPSPFTNQPILILQAIANSQASSQETKYTSARLVSHQTLSRQRGYLHIRVTAPIAAGIWPAIWLLPKGVDPHLLHFTTTCHESAPAYTLHSLILKQSKS